MVWYWVKQDSLLPFTLLLEVMDVQVVLPLHFYFEYSFKNCDSPL